LRRVDVGVPHRSTTAEEDPDPGIAEVVDLYMLDQRSGGPALYPDRVQGAPALNQSVANGDVVCGDGDPAPDVQAVDHGSVLGNRQAVGAGQVHVIRDARRAG